MFGFCSLTCFKVQVKRVTVGVKRSGQCNPHLEGLASADDEVVVLVEIRVMFCAVLTRFAFHQVY